MIEKIKILRQMYNLDRVNIELNSPLEKSHPENTEKFKISADNLSFFCAMLGTGVFLGHAMYKLDKSFETYLLNLEAKSRLKKLSKKKQLVMRSPKHQEQVLDR